uniref:UDP-glucuronosyltransferase n=1 Tax=Seriola dumerili TaxID=41447 RepID=A0A3B4TEC9_SERDU
MTFFDIMPHYTMMFLCAEASDTIFANDTASSSSSSSSYLGNLLVVPMDGSHWVGMKAIAQEMGRRGHRVTVVIPEVSIRMGPGKYYDTEIHPVPYDRAYIDSVASAHKDMMQKSSQSFMVRTKKRFSHILKVIDLIHGTAESLLFNDKDSSLFSFPPSYSFTLQGFDAVLTDPMVPTGSLIARKLGIPTINLLRGIPFSLDVNSAGCPSPPSYVPRFFTGYSDKMSFKERVVNTLVSVYRFKKSQSHIQVNIVILCLNRIDLILEFPRPLMPNMVLVGGINCNVRNPLPEVRALSSWVSGEFGFVVFTLGTMVSDLPEEKTSIFLEAFRQIPQKVIWRYTGQVPDNVPENVKMMGWVPQNDLLAHPGARAFITHAGSHGIFEGLCHAVPMVMMPIGADQHHNAQRLADKGAGVVVDIFSITTESLLQGLNEVLHDVRYKEDVQKLSALHKDRPVEPLDLSVYWTEYVMRHKGAKHLKPAGIDLNWIQYFCLDVIALLASVVLLFGILIVKCMKLCFRKLSRKRKRD